LCFFFFFFFLGGGEGQFFCQVLIIGRSEAKGIPSLLLSAGATERLSQSLLKRPEPKKNLHQFLSPLKTDVSDDDDPPTASGEEETHTEEDPTPSTPDDPDYYFSESTYVSLVPSAPANQLPPYHNPILARFTSMRRRLHLSPPPPSPSLSMSLPQWGDHKIWRDFAARTYPRPSWLWQLQHRDAIRLITYFTRWIDWRLRERGLARKGLAKGWAVWIWGALMRCGDAMVAEDAAEIRALGKCALAMTHNLIEVMEEEKVKEARQETVPTTEEGGNGDPEVQSLIEDDLFSAGSDDEGCDQGETATFAALDDVDEIELHTSSTPLAPSVPPPQKLEEGEEGEEQEGEEQEEGEIISSTPPPPSSPQLSNTEPEYYSLKDTVGMLDMIISVIGDFFGQRDLLEMKISLGGYF
jgi:hypothetical protein